MKKLIVVVAAALGGLAVWRRSTLKEDADRVKNATTGLTSKLRPDSAAKDDSSVVPPVDVEGGPDAATPESGVSKPGLAGDTAAT